MLALNKNIADYGRNININNNINKHNIDELVFGNSNRNFAENSVPGSADFDRSKLPLHRTSLSAPWTSLVVGGH